MSLEQLQAAERQTQQVTAHQIFDFVTSTEKKVPRFYNRWIYSMEDTTSLGVIRGTGLVGIFRITGDVLLSTINEAIVLLASNGLETKFDLAQESVKDEFGIVTKMDVQIYLNVKRKHQLRTLQQNRGNS